MLHKVGSLFFAWTGFILTCIVLAITLYVMGGGIL